MPLIIFSIGSQVTSDFWRVALLSPIKRTNIVRRANQLLTDWKANGVELSWTLGGLELPSDQSLLSSLLSEMRESLPKESLLMVSVSHTATYAKKYPYATIIRTADFIVLHSHRFHSSRQPFTGHHSPLFFDSQLLSDPRNSVEGFVGEWVSLGAPR